MWTEIGGIGMIYAPGQIYRMAGTGEYARIQKCFAAKALCLIRGKHHFVSYDKLLAERRYDE